MDTGVQLTLDYQSGFGNEFETEAIPGAIPQGRNNPQRVAHGLYAEQISGTAFTAPRSENLRTWVYRIRPSAVHGTYRKIDNGKLVADPVAAGTLDPNQMRWDPFVIPDGAGDFVDGLATLMGNGSPAAQSGIALHMYLAAKSMDDRFMINSDGEMLVVPQQGRFLCHSEMGVLEVTPGEICIIPRGVRFRIALPDGPSRGYICENYGMALRPPERGPIGANGLANDRDFLSPTAAFEDREGDFRLVNKYQGQLWECEIGHSPLDVVGWHGNLTPCKYDLDRFNTMGTVSFDHPDPSIFTVLTSPSGRPGTANVDFVIFPPRWMVGEDTFRPPWYHRNVMSEFMGLIYGVYDAKPEGFVPGGASLHNCMAGHGPDNDAFQGASNADLKPEKQTATMAFMFETNLPYALTDWALSAPERQLDYQNCWTGLQRNFTG